MLKAQIHVDMENTEALVKKLKKASVSGFVVGIPGDAKNSETGKPIAEYAMYNEYGTSTIPPRPFLSISRRRFRDKWVDMLIGELDGQRGWRDWINAIISFVRGNRSADIDRAAREALHRVGRVAVADVQSIIKSNVPPPNAKSYAARKLRKRGHINTLIDSGSMRDAVSYWLVDKEWNKI